MDGWYYLHTNGELIFKSVASDPDFNSPFVRKHWAIDISDRKDAWTILLEALGLDANLARVKELATKWGCTYEDSVQMLVQIKPSELMQKGMTVFIEKILGMDLEAYWAEIKAKGETNDSHRTKCARVGSKG